MMMRLLITMTMLLLPTSTEAASVRAGAFAIDVTPEKFPISVNGGMRDRLATGAHDRLHARCLVLSDRTTELAIVVVDSCAIPREVMDDAKTRATKSTGIPSNRILISATHTHTAPTVAAAFQSDPDSDYQQFLARRIAEGIDRAYRELDDAEIGWGVGSDPSHVFNRRWKMKPGSIPPDPFGNTTDTVKMNPGYQAPGLIEPAGPIDPDISILSVRTRDREPLALLANYSLHYVGGVPALSADYFGIFADKIEGRLAARGRDPRFVGIMSNGTSGNINNHDYAEAPPGRREPGEQARLVAEGLAKVAYDVYKDIEHRHDVTLAMAETELELGVRKPTPADIDRAEKILTEAGDRVLTTLPEVYARETVKLVEYPDTVKLKLQAIRIGELGIVAIPCEVFVEIGLELKKKSPLKPTFTIELANGYNGYLPTPKHHEWGGYETWRARSSYLEVQAAPKITRSVLKLLDQVAK